MLKLFTRNETIITNIHSLQIPVNCNRAVNKATTTTTKIECQKLLIKPSLSSLNSRKQILVFDSGWFFFSFHNYPKNIISWKEMIRKIRSKNSKTCVYRLKLFWIHGMDFNKFVVYFCCVCVKCWSRFYFGINTLNFEEMPANRNRGEIR